MEGNEIFSEQIPVFAFTRREFNRYVGLIQNVLLLKSPEEGIDGVP